EPFVALPRAAGPLREFWLATDQRAGQPVVVAAEVTSADEKFEIISTGAAVAFGSAGNAVTYSRPGLVCVPVRRLSPAPPPVAGRGWGWGGGGTTGGVPSGRLWRRAPTRRMPSAGESVPSCPAEPGWPATP